MSSLLRASLVVATGTALSRVSGLVRMFVLAYVIGQTALTDAYLLGNETPNIVYDLLLGGVLSATLVPLFTALLGRGPDSPSASEREHATNVVITTAVALLVALTVLAIVTAPLIFRLYSLDPPSEIDAALFRDVGTTLTRVFLVQIMFYGLTGIANAYLNSRKLFVAAAWSPIAANVVTIVALLSLPDAGKRRWALGDVVSDGRLRWTLGLGTSLGIAVMALIVVAATLRAGLRFRPAWDWSHPAVKRLLRLSGWTFGFVVANQIAVVVIRNLAQAEGEGAAAAYIQAFTFFVLPHGLLAVSIATTFQPDLARSVVERDRVRFADRMTLGVRLIALLTLPAAAALIALRDPIIGLMVRGQFGDAAAATTASALSGLAVGLAAFSVYLFVLRGFYAHHDTRTPFVLNVGENMINIVLAAVFVRWWGVGGLGLAYAAAYVLAAAWALQVMSYKAPRFSARAIIFGLKTPLLAAVLMGESIWLVTRGIDRHTGWAGAVELIVGGGVGLVVYLAVLAALGAPEVGELRRRMRRVP